MWYYGSITWRGRDHSQKVHQQTNDITRPVSVKVMILNNYFFRDWYKRSWHLQKHVDIAAGFWPWPSLIICFLTFSWRISTSESTIGGLLSSWGGSSRTKELASAIISFLSSTSIRRIDIRMLKSGIINTAETNGSSDSPWTNWICLQNLLGKRKIVPHFVGWSHNQCTSHIKFKKKKG